MKGKVACDNVEVRRKTKTFGCANFNLGLCELRKIFPRKHFQAFDKLEVNIKLLNFDSV